jgi:hypothetical protein
VTLTAMAKTRSFAVTQPYGRFCEDFRTPASHTRRASHRSNGPAFENPPKKETAGGSRRRGRKLAAYGDLRALCGGARAPHAANGAFCKVGDEHEGCLSGLCSGEICVIGAATQQRVVVLV